ncbi:potassium-transporting ATPase subunit KdpB [Candidatus Methylospira mobilis]|uniref:Potassium-transporting ATPase ATP-binding subunit n=1 Tax=Candidatus Methylospira mobilis TaxID=1808979 RepID=A0A5Q0BKL8_9GAMM|nr:potassium-transporting ATPase subunit KdpB [Candidatus Methylospira mobilis]QFY44383.1 potassium-transporting ATPase subunit KdpB [Candidatus Methylospira mobilis]
MKQPMFSLLSPQALKPALWESLAKMAPRVQMKNPVMFVCYIGSIATSVLLLQALLTGKDADTVSFILAIALWLWFTVLFANIAEALAEGRSKAQAATLRSMRKTAEAKKLRGAKHDADWTPVSAGELRCGDVFLVEAGDVIPADGEIVEGAASVDESAITGESASVVRESGGDFCSVTGGTVVLSDWLVVRVAADPGDSFLDRMIAMVESAKRSKTPNEIALTIVLVMLTFVFLVVAASILPYALFSANAGGTPVSIPVLVALLICLIPTTIGGLLSAIGVAGMSRMFQANVIATSGRAVEAAGDVDVLMLDKTGTITFGHRHATDFYPAPGVTEQMLAEAAVLSSLADETPEGRSIVLLAHQCYSLKNSYDPEEIDAVIPFTARTRMSGVDMHGRQLRKGAADAVQRYVEAQGRTVPEQVRRRVESVANNGSTPLVVTDGATVLGVIELKDVVKSGIRERFADLRRMGIRTIMITGDNHLTAAAIAAEAGVDEFLSEATPEAKLELIRTHKSAGRVVAMTGDGTNDAPALAQADVAVAMNSGTQAAKEASNMVDLDSNPTKLIEIVEIGKQMLMTRGALTTFSVANDVAKYFAIIPAAFVGVYPQLGAMNVMNLATPSSAILSAVIFNALIIVLLIPLALKGVTYRPLGAAQLFGRNLLVYGVGGFFAPFIGIKVIDMALTTLSFI